MVYTTGDLGRFGTKLEKNSAQSMKEFKKGNYAKAYKLIKRRKQGVEHLKKFVNQLEKINVKAEATLKKVM